VLNRTHPAAAERYLRLAQKHAETRFQLYEQLAHLAVQRAETPPAAPTTDRAAAKTAAE